MVNNGYSSFQWHLLFLDVCGGPLHRLAEINLSPAAARGAPSASPSCLSYFCVGCLFSRGLPSYWMESLNEWMPKCSKVRIPPAIPVFLLLSTKRGSSFAAQIELSNFSQLWCFRFFLFGPQALIRLTRQIYLDLLMAMGLCQKVVFLLNVLF